MGEGEDFECPDCGTDFSFGTPACPGCGVEVEWDGVQATDVVTDELDLLDPRLPHYEEPVEASSKVFSVFGLACALLTIAAFVGTVLLMRWDTWIGGAAEDTIGDRQRLLIYLGAVATTVFALLSIIDLIRVSSKQPILGEGDY